MSIVQISRGGSPLGNARGIGDKRFSDAGNLWSTKRFCLKTLTFEIRLWSIGREEGWK